MCILLSFAISKNFETILCKRYRDDTLDICVNSSEEEQKEVTNWMNDNICKDRIKFKIEEMGPDVKFLDTQLRMIKDERHADEDKYIIAPSMHSKDKLNLPWNLQLFWLINLFFNFF